MSCRNLLERWCLTSKDDLLYSAELLEEVARLLAPYHDEPLPPPVFLAAQRWGSALYPGLHADESETDMRLVLMIPNDRFAACGDFMAGSRIPDVIMNAQATAQAIVHRILK